jgi:hypothetical protein
MLIRNIIALVVSLVLGVASGWFDTVIGGLAVIGLVLVSYLTNAALVSWISPRWSVLFGCLMNSVTFLTVLIACYENYPHHTAAEVQATVESFGGYFDLCGLWLCGLGIALAVGLIVSFIVRWHSLRLPSPPPSVEADRPMGEEQGVWPPAPRGPLP